MKKTVPLLFAVSFFAIVVFDSCKKDDDTEPTPSVPSVSIDEIFYDEVKSDSGYTYFQNGDTLRAIAPSPHGKFRVRFNSIAQAALDTSGALPTGGTFPENSIIVKDIYDGTALKYIAAMKKSASNEHAASGWIWVEYNGDGSVFYTAENKGSACTGCHSSDKHRDLVKLFDLH